MAEVLWKPPAEVAQCSLCDREGFLWFTDDGRHVDRDHLEADHSFRCHHSTGYRNRVQAVLVSRWRP